MLGTMLDVVQLILSVVTVVLLYKVVKKEDKDEN